MALMCSNLHLPLVSPSISKSAAAAAAASMPSSSSSSSTSPISFFVPRRTANGRVKTQRPAAMLRMGPEEEKLTRRNPLDFPIEWERPKPGRRPDIFPQFSPMKTPLPPPMPYDPPEEDEEDEEKKDEEEDPEKEEEENPPESRWFPFRMLF